MKNLMQLCYKSKEKKQKICIWNIFKSSISKTWNLLALSLPTSLSRLLMIPTPQINPAWLTIASGNALYCITNMPTDRLSCRNCCLPFYYCYSAVNSQRKFHSRCGGGFLSGKEKAVEVNLGRNLSVCIVNSLLIIHIEEAIHYGNHSNDRYRIYTIVGM